MIDVEIEDSAWTGALPDAGALARIAANAVLAFDFPPGGPDPRSVKTGGVSILLTDNATVRALNHQFRHKDAATNVLAFPAASNPENLLGDIALAYGVCAEEAVGQRKPLAHHLQHLTVHGVLHLLGYDHLSDDDAEVMEDLERSVLAELGVPDPYDAGEGDHDRS